MPRTRPGFTEVLAVHDVDGHRIILKEEKKTGNCKVFIQLIGDSRERLIGEVDRKRKMMVVKRDHSKHFHHIMKGYGFNWVIVNQRVPVEYNKILLIERDENGMDYYIIPLGIIQTMGIKKNFKAGGYELQYFLDYKKMLEFRKSGITYVKGVLVGDV